MYVTTYYFPLIHICLYYNLPEEIFHIIYNIVINFSAQIIIHKWFSYINIHNTNLCYLINKIPINQGLSFQADHILYYDLYNPKLWITIKICFKYIKVGISSTDWWLNICQYIFNGLIFIDNLNSINKNNIILLNHFYHILS